MSLPVVKFERPPVVEVVFGVAFRDVPGYTTARAGEFWQSLKSEYGLTEDQPPIPPVTEAFDEEASVELTWGALPPMRRTWFITADRLRLIQVQADRFHYNRKRTPSQQYVHYSESKKEFQRELDRFKGFLVQTCQGEFAPRQYELTYVNVIPQGGPFQSLRDIGNVFRDIQWTPGNKNILGDPESTQWKTSFRMPNQQGRLHVQLANGVVAGKGGGAVGLQLQLTARGYSKDTSTWFDTAHSWIVNAFADLTTAEMQKFWGRVS